MQAKVEALGPGVRGCGGEALGAQGPRSLWSSRQQG